MVMKKFDVIIIGAGPGGIESALQARQVGLSTLLITGSKLGGRAVWGSLVPSKVWLTVAEKMDDLRNMHLQGLLVEDFSLDMEVIKERIHMQSSNTSQRYFQQLQQAGISIEHGQAVLSDAHTVHLICADETSLDYSGEYIIISSGSEPHFLPTIKPDGKHILAPRHTAALEEIPSSLVIAGGGISGVEYGYAFAALGAEVTLIQRNNQILPGFDSEMVRPYQTHLEQRYAIQFITGQAVESMRWTDDDGVETKLVSGRILSSEAGLITMGRRADLSFYDPATLSLALTPQGFLAVNSFQQTSQPHIYAVGDVTGDPMMANKAIWEARKAIRHLSGGMVYNVPILMEAVFTQPSLVQLGQPPVKPHHTVEIPLHTLLKSQLSGKEEGILRIYLNEDNRIAAAAGFGLHLPEIMAVLQTAVQQGIPWHELSFVPFGYPSATEILTSTI